MSATFTGLDELRLRLQDLPEDLREEGGELVLRIGDAAVGDLQAGYLSRKVSGNLARGVRKDTWHNPFGTAVRIRSTAPHAFMFENGTQVRKIDGPRYAGANRGAARPGKVFVPIMRRHRRTLMEGLADLLDRAGLDVDVG
jgi:hypothetical protein